MHLLAPVQNWLESLPGLLGRGTDPNTHVSHTLTPVIVMTFWYVFIGTDLTFSNFLNFYSSLGIDHDPPCSLCSHDLCLFPFLMFHTLHDHMAKRSHYRIMIF